MCSMCVIFMYWSFMFMGWDDDEICSPLKLVRGITGPKEFGDRKSQFL
jgi:hypothetical protein